MVCIAGKMAQDVESIVVSSPSSLVASSTWTPSLIPRLM